MQYSEIYSKLCVETALIIFFKSNGEIRLMLGTRNLQTVALKWGFQGYALGGFDNRCNINNGNVAVFDILLGDARCFKVDRLIEINYYGEIRTLEDLEKTIDKFNKFKKAYEDAINKE